MKTDAFRPSPSGSLTTQYLQRLSFLHLQLRRLLRATVASIKLPRPIRFPLSRPGRSICFSGQNDFALFVSRVLRAVCLVLPNHRPIVM